MYVFPTGDLLAGLVGMDVCFVFHVCQSDTCMLGFVVM